MIIFIFLVFGSACQPIFPHNLPDTELIYQADYKVLGFVDADGQANQVLVINQQFAKPVWSADGQYLFGLSKGKGVSWGYPAVWDLSKKRFKVCDWNQPHFGQIQSYDDPENPYMVIVQHTEAIILFDIKTCKQKQLLVDYSGQASYAIAGFSYSQARQELVYGLLVDPYRDRQYRLMHKNLTTEEEIQLAEGINPSWSPDGSLVAFVGFGGIYLISITDKDAVTTRLSDEPLFDPWESGSPDLFASRLSWSPDGEWIVYHHCRKENSCRWNDNDIYKINIHRKVPVLVLEDGYYPSWHP